MRSDMPAFPVIASHNVYSNGMRLRDYFAAQALAGMLANTRSTEIAAQTIVGGAYEVADAMLAEREKSQ